MLLLKHLIEHLIVPLPRTLPMPIGLLAWATVVATAGKRNGAAAEGPLQRQNGGDPLVTGMRNILETRV